MNQLAVRFLTGFVFICFYVASYSALLQHRNNVPETAHTTSGIWNLPPVALLAVAGEFKGLMADYLTLEAGAQLGTELVRKPEGGYRIVKKEHDWQGIHKIFLASQTLDPAFAQTYIMVQGWLPWEPVDMVAETQEFLGITATNRPWDWRPIHTMGFNSYYFLNDPGKAGTLFLEAANKPDAPNFLSILGARLAQKGGETRAAIALLQSMLIDKQETDPGYSDIVDRLHALQGILVIEQAKVDYEKKYGTRPQFLMDLIASKILLSIPDNPYDVAYCMDTEGKIYFDNPNCRGEDR